MNKRRPQEDDHIFFATNIQFEDFEVSWAGEDPYRHGFCFGSTDGRIRCTETHSPNGFGPSKATQFGDAINGIAFFDNFMAVSTRSEISLFSIPPPDNPTVLSTHYWGGAHDITVRPSGGFVASLGIRGLLTMNPRLEEGVSSKVNEASGKTLNYYRTLGLGRSSEGDIVSCAVRKDGLATALLTNSDKPGFVCSLTFPGLDVVDLCTFGSERMPLAVVGLGKDRSIHLSQDVLNDRRPVSLRFDGLEGKAYRVFVSQGHMLLLTSEWLYVLRGLAERFVAGQRIDLPTQIRGLKLRAIDAYTAFDKWLLIITPQRVISAEISALAAESELATGKSGQEIILRPDVPSYSWESTGNLAMSQALAASA
jgi:hypothetical protein